MLRDYNANSLADLARGPTTQGEDEDEHDDDDDDDDDERFLCMFNDAIEPWNRALESSCL